MAVSRFEDLAAWQKASALAVEVYRVTARGGLQRDFGLRDQMQRAAVSAMSNIAEGFERYGRQEFKHFLSIARGSAGELRSQLYLARDLGYITGDEHAALMARCLELTRMRTALSRSLG